MKLITKSTVLFLIFSTFLYAQEYSLSGTVADEAGNPLIGANVTLNKTLIGASTNSKGKFQLNNIHTGDYSLTVSMVGYSEYNINLLVDRNIYDLNIQLKPTTYQSDQVVVTAGKYEQNLRDLPVSALVVQSEEIIKKNYLTFDEALRDMPGVSVTLDQVSIRGSSGYSRGAGTRVMVALDGIPLYTGDSGEIIWEIIPIKDIERVEVIKGASSALYGSTALGGVINVISKNVTSEPLTYVNTYFGAYTDPSHNEWKWADDLLSFYGVTLSHSQSFGNLGVSASLSKFQNSGYRQNDLDERYAGYLKLNYRFDESNALNFFASGYLRKRETFNFWKDIENALSPPDSDVGDEQPSDRFMFGLSFDHVFSPDFSLSFRPSVYRTFWKDQTESANKSKSYLYRTEVRGKYKISESLNFVGGVEGILSEANSNIFGDNNAVNFGVFSQLDYKFIEPLTFTFGARYDFSKLSSMDPESAVSPKAGVNYKLSESTVLRTSFGYGFRAPSLAEAFTSTVASGISVKPNSNIKSESNYSFEFGINHLFAQNFFVDLALFQTEYFDLIEPRIDPADTKVVFDNVTRARIQGAELNSSVGFFNNHLNLDFGYVYLWARDTQNEKSLKYRSRHNFMVSAEYNYYLFSLGVDFRYSSKVEQIDFELVEFGLVPDGDKRVDIKVLDLRFDANLFQAGLPGRVFVNVKNALNYNYVEMIGNIQPIRNYSINLELMF